MEQILKKWKKSSHEGELGLLENNELKIDH